jgi:hypothetical protein
MRKKVLKRAKKYSKIFLIAEDWRKNVRMYGRFTNGETGEPSFR